MSHAQPPPPPVCTITADPPTPGPNQAFSLCGPIGAGYTYTWRDANDNILTHDRCLQFPGGLPVGCHEFEMTISQGAAFLKCPYEICIREAPCPPNCDISIRPEGDICDDDEITLCGPVCEGFTYTWRDGADNIISHERCITVGPLSAGTHDYSLTVSQGPAYVKCPVEIRVLDCGHLNCPHTVGFWHQQCEQKDGGSTKFTVGQMTQITQAVDGLSSFFSWGGTSFASFCAIIDPPKPMDQREQAKRQFAALLANVATGNLGIPTNKGQQIFIDLTTPIDCDGLNAGTIGELITEVNTLLGQLEGQSLELESVKTAYGNIITCTDDINNGIGIGDVCRDEEESKPFASRAGLEPSGAIELYRPSPTPFSGQTRMMYAVRDGGEMVDIGVYDVAGRMVQKLASGYQAAGRHTVSWDGTSATGVRQKSGVFFIRGTVGGRSFGARLLLLK